MPPNDELADPFACVKEAQAAVYDCEGARLHSELGGVARTYRVFVGNDREFQALFAHYDNNVQARLELWDTHNRDGFDAFLDEVDRLLHNYLAAATSLRDHTRRLWRQDPPPDMALTAEYDERVKRTFADSPLANFVQRLRNYMTHSKLPVAQGKFTWEQGSGESSTVALSKAALLEWDDWNVAARAFLDEADDDIDLSDVLRDYTALVHDFNQWFGRAFVEGHLPAFDELEDRTTTYNNLLHELGLVPPEAES